MLGLSIICVLIILSMLLCIIKYPIIKIKKLTFQSFWIIPVLGVIIIICFGFISLKDIRINLTTNTTVNPLKILLLFFSMTFISILLDELNFFDYLANLAVKHAKGKQISLFFILYLLTSFLTIFTSNDIIVLTFTPFIIFFAKEAKINPIPYLISEFISANTWSMIFIIGNPTNIYLATNSGITFINYFSKMFLPTILSGIGSLLLLLLIFKKQLQKPLDIEYSNVIIKDKFLLICNLICLISCTILLVISSYINIEMYLITFTFASILLLVLIINTIVKKEYPLFKSCIKRLPWSLIPFMISMFIIVLALEYNGISEVITNAFNNQYPLLTYGFTSTITCNLINNIPMSVLYSEIIPLNNLKALYATIIGSNIGAFLTPVGALAGIMWLSILKKHDIDFSFLSFIKYGVVIAIPTLLLALLGLYIML